MLPDHTIEIEPVEYFLSKILDPDKLSLYQPIIDLFKELELKSIIDAINSIVLVADNASPSEVLQEIHDAFNKYLTQSLMDFDISVDSGSLKFLYDLYKIVSLLENYEDHNLIINICNDVRQSTVDRLYELCNHLKAFDELEFMDSVKMVSMSFFNRLIEIHSQMKEELEEVTPIQINRQYVNVLKALKSKYPKLAVFDIIENNKLQIGSPVESVTAIATEYMEDYTLRDHKQVCMELISLYLLSNTPSSSLLKTVKEEMLNLISDDGVMLRVNAALGSVHTEVMNYG